MKIILGLVYYQLHRNRCAIFHRSSYCNKHADIPIKIQPCASHAMNFLSVTILKCVPFIPRRAATILLSVYDLLFLPCQDQALIAAKSIFLDRCTLMGVPSANNILFRPAGFEEGNQSIN